MPYGQRYIHFTDYRKSCNFSNCFRKALLKHARRSFFRQKKCEAAGKKCEAGRFADYIPGETLIIVMVIACSVERLLK